jgi:hypothetical protein
MKLTKNDQLPHGKLGFLHFLYGFPAFGNTTTPKEDKKEKEKAREKEKREEEGLMAYSQIGDRVEGPSRCLTGAESPFLDCVRLRFSLTLESTRLLYALL